MKEAVIFLRIRSHKPRMWKVQVATRVEKLVGELNTSRAQFSHRSASTAQSFSCSLASPSSFRVRVISLTWDLDAPTMRSRVFLSTAELLHYINLEVLKYRNWGANSIDLPRQTRYWAKPEYETTMSLSIGDCLWNETRFDKMMYWPGLESSFSDWSSCSLCRLTAACAWVRSCSNISGFDCCICSPNCWALVRQKKLKTFITCKQNYPMTMAMTIG